MWEKTKQFRKTLLFLAAIPATAFLSYQFSQYQFFKERQAYKTYSQVLIVENDSLVELVKLLNQANQIDTNCINHYSTCDKAKVTDEINAINKEQDTVNQNVQEEVKKLLPLMKK